MRRAGFLSRGSRWHQVPDSMTPGLAEGLPGPPVRGLGTPSAPAQPLCAGRGGGCPGGGGQPLPLPVTATHAPCTASLPVLATQVLSRGLPKTQAWPQAPGPGREGSRVCLEPSGLVGLLAAKPSTQLPGALVPALSSFPPGAPQVLTQHFGGG